MPLPKSGSKYWPNVFKKLDEKLRSMVFRAVPSEQLNEKTRQRLMELQSRLMRSNLEEGSFFTVAFERYAAQLELHGLNTIQMGEAFSHFADIADVNEAVKRLQCSILSHARVQNYTLDTPDDNPTEEPSALSKVISHDPKIDFSADQLQQNIDEFIDERYSPVDERVLSCGERRLRRMDSLSRLLLPGSHISACTAVTLDCSETPTLIIGSNVDKNGYQERIVEEITLKLNTIRQTLTTILADADMQQDTDEISLDSLAQQLVEKLRPSPFPNEVLHQAARKLIDAICFDNETFTKEEKQAFVNTAPATIILPTVGDGCAGMQVHLLNSENHIVKHYSLTKISKVGSVKYIHAEQLIAYYLFEELNIKPKPGEPLVFGISKLCCPTCFINLKKYNKFGEEDILAVRGHHGQVYLGVVDLTSGISNRSSSIRPGTTEQWSSPKFTPEDRQKRKINLPSDSSSIPKAAKRVLILDEPTPQGNASDAAKLVTSGLFSARYKPRSHPVCPSTLNVANVADVDITGLSVNVKM